MNIDNMNSKYLQTSISALVVISLVFGAQLALASGVYQNLRTAAGTDLARNGDIVLMIGKIVGVVIGLLGVVLALIIIYGGFTWMTANGDSKKVEKGKDMIRNAVIGLIIVFAAYAVTSFVLRNLTGITGGGASGGAVDYPVH